MLRNRSSRVVRQAYISKIMCACVSLLGLPLNIERLKTSPQRKIARGLRNDSDR